MIKLLKNLLGENNYLKLKVFFFSKLYSNDLNKLATFFGTDKWGSHYYTKHYQNLLQHLRNKEINLLEIGVGGYENPEWGGGSLRMWKAFFTKGKIVSFDIYDKTHLSEKRIVIEQGSQIDEEFLLELNKKHGPFDVIIDDGSHINSHVISTFNILYPLLKENGYYLIEDVQTSYFPEYGGDSNNLDNKKTIMGYFKSILDSVNHQEILGKRDGEPSFFKEIYSITFIHNLIFLNKKQNNEKSNLVSNGELIKHGRILE